MSYFNIANTVNIERNERNSNSRQKSKIKNENENEWW